MEFKIEEIHEYEGKIKKLYQFWSEQEKISFLNWVYYRNEIKRLDRYMTLQENPDYEYNRELKKYLDIGCEVLYSKGDQENPIRDDLKEIIENEKIIYHKELGIIGNIVKIDDRNGKISLRPFDFYYELKESEVPAYQLSQKVYGEIHEVKKIMDDYDLTTPWTKANEELLLTRQLNGTPKTTKEIIATFNGDIINALGYVKKDGKVYVKN